MAKSIQMKQGSTNISPNLDGVISSNLTSDFSGISIVDGGYCKIGNLVVVNIRLSGSVTGDGSKRLLRGFPRPKSEAGVSSAVLMCNSTNNNVLMLHEGSLFLNQGASIPSSSYVSCTYICE